MGQRLRRFFDTMEAYRRLGAVRGMEALLLQLCRDFSDALGPMDAQQDDAIAILLAYAREFEEKAGGTLYALSLIHI